jgi:hypothetical protein
MVKETNLTNNNNTFKLLVDVKLDNFVVDDTTKNYRSFNGQRTEPINSTSKFLQNFKRSLLVLVLNECKSSEPTEIRIISKYLVFLL